MLRVVAANTDLGNIDTKTYTIRKCKINVRKKLYTRGGMVRPTFRGKNDV